jgi:hypothetical protein
MSKGIDLIAAERKRQIEVEGWTAEHDAAHTKGELAQAATCYVWEAALREALGGNYYAGEIPTDWPFDPGWWKPTPGTIGNLIKAGALIASEIDRLCAAEATEERNENASRS